VLTAAVIGVGTGANVRVNSIGYVHAQAYRSSPRCRLVAAADLDARNLDRFVERFGVAGHRSAEELLAAHRPDVVSIATYAGSHRLLLELAVERGVRRIWCEKPLALTADDAYAMRQLCDKHGVRVVVHHYRRYLSCVRRVRQLLESGAIGEPTEFVAAGGEGDLMEMGTHWLDLLRCFAGDRDVRWVMGQGAIGQARTNFAGVDYGHELDAYALAFFAFADGTRGILECGAADQRAPQTAFRLSGTDGRVDLDHDGTIRLFNRTGCTRIETGSTLHDRKPDAGDPDPYQVVLDTLLDWDGSDPEPEISLSSAVRTTELYLAAYQSAIDSGRVCLPLTGQRTSPLSGLADRAGCRDQPA
jgi:predicted dehydrogenase